MNFSKNGKNCKRFLMFFFENDITTRYINCKVNYLSCAKVLNRMKSMPHFNLEQFFILKTLTRYLYEIYRALIVPNWPHWHSLNRGKRVIGMIAF